MKLTPNTTLDHATWNRALAALPLAHVLQTWEWGEFKRVTTGWQPHRIAFEQDGAIVAMASVGVRRVGSLSVMYAPKGPALTYENIELAHAVLAELEKLARRRGAIWLKIDPDVVAGTGVPGELDALEHAAGGQFTRLLAERSWRASADQVQFRNTITVDLTQSEETLLAAMSQNTRRKVRVAEREGVQVRAGDERDVPLLYSLYKETGERDHFLIRPASYYEQAWRAFIAAGLAHPLIAEVEGQPVAAVLLFHFARTCWYLYGASSAQHRDKMPNYLLQWEAMRWAKRQGYSTYDFWGAPDNFDESDSMWGVYNFKRGFRGTVTRHIGAWDYAPNPLLYRAYTDLMPRVIGWMRRAGESKDRKHPSM